MPLDIPRIRLLCFDVDGTLHETDDQYVSHLAKWLRLVKALLPERDPYHAARKILMVTETPATLFFGLPDRLGVDHHLSAIGDFFYRQGLSKKITPFALVPGVWQMLEQLSSKYPMTVVTARGNRSTNLLLTKTNLKPFFKVIATSQTCRHTKPYPDPILWVANQTGIPVEACVMIGDTTVDILAGKAAGAQTIGVLCGFGTEKELRAAGADLILESTSKLAEIFG